MPNEQNSSVTPKKENNGAKVTARKVWGWYYEGRDLSSKFRQESDTDCAYYDNEQWTEEEKQELDDRGQPATVFNRIKPTVDLILGTEAKARVDFHAAPRKNSGITDAAIATESLKYVMDQNEGEYLISTAFESEIKAGWQWVELSKNEDPFKEIVKVSLVPRNELIWDPLAKEFNKSDGKYMIRPKWLDLEDGVAKFPRKASILEQAVSTEEIEPYKEHPYQSTEAEADRPGVPSWRDAPVSITEWVDKTRKRVKLLECWYKVPQEVWLIDNEETGDVEEFNPDKLAQVLLTPGAKLIKKWLKKVRLCIVAGNEIIQDGPSPHRHNEYPFVPFWAYLKDKDGSPYGLIRQLRDPQDEINKRRSKALHLMNSKQIIATSDVIDNKQNDWKEVAEAVNDPEGVIKLDAQKLSQGGKFEIITPDASIAEQSKFAEEAKREIEEAGVNRELQGLQSNAQSGRAIIARQIQGNTMLGKPFDNYRRSRQLLGQLTWAMIQQYWTRPKSIRVTDKLGNFSFIDVNERVDFNGRIFVRNDVTRAKVDIVIDEQAFNATIRQSLADQMFELITKLPPEVSLLLLDEVVDFIDLPNKERLMTKIKMAQGVMATKVQQEQENQRMLAQAGMARAQVGQNQLNTRPEEKAMSEGLA